MSEQPSPTAVDMTPYTPTEVQNHIQQLSSYAEDELAPIMERLALYNADASLLHAQNEYKTAGWSGRRTLTQYIGVLAQRGWHDDEDAKAKGTEKCLEFVRKALLDDDDDVRTAGLHSLLSLQVEPDTIVPLIKKHLKDSHWKPRQHAHIVLEEFNRNTKLDLSDLVPLVKQGLNDDDSDVQQAAMKAMVSLSPEEGLEELRGVVAEGEWRKRTLAGELLGQYGNEDDLEHINTLLVDNDGDVRKSALTGYLRWLERFGREDAAQLKYNKLLRYIADSNDSVAQTAFEHIVQTEDKETLTKDLMEQLSELQLVGAQLVLPYLREHARETIWPWVEKLEEIEEDEVRYVAATELLAYNPDNITERLEQLLDDRHYRTRAFAAQNLLLVQLESRKELLLRVLNDDNSMVQHVAFGYLDEFNDPDILEVLLQRWNDLETNDQQKTLRLAIRCEYEDIPKLVSDVLEHAGWSERRDLVHDLGTSGLPAALPIVMERLENDSDDDVQAAALEAAIKLAPSQIGMMLEKARHSEYWRVRQRAAECAGEHGSSDVRPLLEPFLSDDDSDVRNAALAAVMKLAPPEERTALALEKLDDENHALVEQATQVLLEHDNPEDVLVALDNKFPSLYGSYSYKIFDLVAALAPEKLSDYVDRIPDVESSNGRAVLARHLLDREDTPNRIQLWKKLAEDEDPNVNSACLEALYTTLPHEEGVPYAKRAMEALSYTTRQSAVSFLGTTDNAEFLPLVKAKLEDSDDDVRVAAMHASIRMDPTNKAEYARTLLYDSHWKPRQHALQELASCGGEQDLERVKELLEDEDYDVRRAAFDAALSIAPEKKLELALQCIGDSDSDIQVKARSIVDEDPNLDKVTMALEHLPHTHNNEAAEFLMEIIDSEAPERWGELRSNVTQIEGEYVRERIVDAMFDSEEPVTMEELEALRHDSSGTIRKHVFDALWERLPGERTLLAGEALKDGNWQIRLAGVQALQEDPEPALLDDLLPLSRDSDCDVRREAVRALAHYQNIRVFGELVSAMDDTDESVRSAAEESLKKVRKSPFLSRVMQAKTGVPIWVQIRRTVEEVNKWAAQTGQEVLGRPVVVNQPNHEKEDQFEDDDDTVLRLELSEKPVTWCHPNGEEVMRGTALYKIGHYLCNEGERGFKTMTGIAKSEGIKDTYDLIAKERVDRNLRSRRTEWRIPLDHVASYAFAKNVYRVSISDLATLAEMSVEDVTNAIKTGELPGRLLPPSKTRNVQLVSLRDRDLLRIPNALPPMMAFVWCLLCGFEAQHHPNPKVGEALALIPSNLRTLPHSKVLQVSREVAELLGKDEQNKQDMQNMQQKLGNCSAAAQRMMNNNLRRLGQSGFLPEWLEQQVNQQGPNPSMNVQCRKRRQVVHQRPPRSMQKLAGGQTLNLGPELDYPKLSHERSLTYNRETHSQVVATIRKHIRRMRSYFERLGQRTIDEYAMRRGHRIDMQMARKSSLTRSPNLLVHTTDEIHANLYLGVLIDRSGSMDGEKLERAKRFGALVTESARGLRGISGHINAFDDDTFIYLGDFQRNGVAQLDSGGANNDAAALERAAELALSSRKKNRLLVMISDGSPTECSVESLKQLVEKLKRDYGIVCAQVAVESLPEIAFPHYIDLSEYNVEEAVTRFGSMLMKLTSAWR
ncbi:MAG: VWA domain-containing protein [Deltaproteobacteria bacterium]|nr:MAG: VWA domain-containing protein [Deltaproteobacteria bacterium]